MKQNLKHLGKNTRRLRHCYETSLGLSLQQELCKIQQLTCKIEIRHYSSNQEETRQLFFSLWSSFTRTHAKNKERTRLAPHFKKEICQPNEFCLGIPCSESLNQSMNSSFSPQKYEVMSDKKEIIYLNHMCKPQIYNKMAQLLRIFKEHLKLIWSQFNI